MDISNREIRILLLHEFRLSNNASEATRNICCTMGEGVIAIRTAQHWFKKFNEGDFDLNDSPRPGRPVVILIYRRDISAVRYFSKLFIGILFSSHVKVDLCYIQLLTILITQE